MPVAADAPFLNQTFDTKSLLTLIEKEQVFVAAESTDVVVGFIIISKKSGCAYIEEIDVLQEHGQKGLGKALIERSFAWAKEQRFARIFLRTAQNVPWNGPMYARLGFRPIAESLWTNEMHTIHNEEKVRGLPVADRIFMYRLL